MGENECVKAEKKRRTMRARLIETFKLDKQIEGTPGSSAWRRNRTPWNKNRHAHETELCKGSYTHNVIKEI